MGKGAFKGVIIQWGVEGKGYVRICQLGENGSTKVNGRLGWIFFFSIKQGHFGKFEEIADTLYTSISIFFGGEGGGVILRMIVHVF